MTEPPAVSSLCACTWSRASAGSEEEGGGRRLLTGDKVSAGQSCQHQISPARCDWVLPNQTTVKRSEAVCVWKRGSGRRKWGRRRLCCVYNENIFPGGPFGLLADRLGLKRPSTQPVSFLITTKPPYFQNLAPLITDHSHKLNTALHSHEEGNKGIQSDISPSSGHKPNLQNVAL